MWRTGIYKGYKINVKLFSAGVKKLEMWKDNQRVVNYEKYLGYGEPDEDYFDIAPTTIEQMEVFCTIKNAFDSLAA